MVTQGGRKGANEIKHNVKMMRVEKNSIIFVRVFCFPLLARFFYNNKDNEIARSITPLVKK